MFNPEPGVKKKTDPAFGGPKSSHGAMNPFKEAQEEIFANF
jgi:hypothetical protein